MLSEEEKKAIKRIEKHLIERLNKYEAYSDCLDLQSYYRNGDIKILLNLIEKQQKELNSLKEIEKSHQEENGKLRVELEQEKEKNKELEKLVFRFSQERDIILKTPVISKDKIKERMEQTKKVYDEEMKPYLIEVGDGKKILNVTYLSKKEKDELINKRNCLLVQIKTYEMLLEEK